MPVALAKATSKSELFFVPSCSVEKGLIVSCSFVLIGIGSDVEVLLMREMAAASCPPAGVTGANCGRWAVGVLAAGGSMAA